MSKLVGINSLRFFAIAFIVTYHLFREFLPGGFLAVEIFFCLSGFLVTSKIIREIKSTKNIKYDQFLRSRFERLFPALLACIVFSLVLGAIVNPDVLTGARTNTFTALTFSTNISELFVGGSYENTFLPNLFEHTWFLALLFQFYLILPLVFKLFLKICDKPRDAIRSSGIALLLLGISSAVLMACYGGFFGMPDRAYFALDSHMAALCLGSAFAVYNYFRPRAPRTVNRLPLVSLLLSLAAITVLAFLVRYDSPLAFIVAMPTMACLTIIVIICIIRLQNNIHERKKTMNAIRIFESIGKLSYGIYLFHWPLYILLPHVLPSDTATWGYAMINISLSIALSALTYRAMQVENPFKTFRKRRRISRVSRLAFASVLLAIATFTLVRAPKTSSIAEQLSSAAGQSTEELTEQSAVENNFLDLAAVLNETVSTMDSFYRLAQNQEVLPAPSGSLAAANANEAKVLVIGDSVTLGAKQAIEATIAKSFVDAKENRGIETARGIIANYGSSGRLPSIIVISLATNQRTITEQTIQEIIDVAGKDHKYILVTAYAGPLQPRDEQNATLKSYASSHDGVYLADWWNVAHDNWSLMYADHIHLNPAGRTAYANLLSNVIRGMR
jgi:peptidoglycan/LPS O-acetylase OafA/YrhL